MSDKFLVTGATGFVGQGLIAMLKRQGAPYCAVARRTAADTAIIPSIDGKTDWQALLPGIGIVVHTAARVHLLADDTANPLAEFRKVNVEGTLNLARQAAQAGVRRFIFISSIKVHGEKNHHGLPFSADDQPRPEDAYAISKYEAEQGLLELARTSGMQVVIIRPPLVYGIGVKANFDLLMKAIIRGIPLPLGAISNRRSFVALDNLLDLIWTCAHHPAAANQVFLVSDGDDLSTPELISRLAFALKVPARLISVPVSLFRSLAYLLGKKKMSSRLCDSLLLDIDKTCRILQWYPPVTMAQALEETAKFYQSQR
ncbi:SDR family oxidoreductase [Chitinibacter sp. FCG-7]|uniref:SDR family oxidoreductase n=1 Tax=Chitinibacter mangrovi TaxID=3153927 RepID=A0AAU7F8R1_9NEIS